MNSLKSQRGFTLRELVVVLFVLTGLGTMIAGICILGHFISKFW